MSNGPKWADSLPPDWQALRLGQLAERVGSGVTPTGGSEVYTPSGVTFIRSQNVTNSGLLLDDVAYIESRTHQRMRASAVFPNDVLLNITGASIGRCCAVPTGFNEANVNQHVCAIRLPNPTAHDAKVLSALLASHIGQAQINRFNAGANREGLNYQQLRSFLLPWPPGDYRKAIARVLSTIDEAIEWTEVLIAKYQQIKAGLMHDLFTRGVTPDGHLRPPRSEAPHLYNESPLGWIPRDWGYVPTEDKIEVIDPQPDHRTPPEVPEGLPYIGIGEISASGEIMFDGARRVSPKAFDRQLRAFNIYPGAFIFGKIGTLGSPTRIPHQRFFALSANVVLFTTVLADAAAFVFWVYHSHLIERQVVDATNTTSQPALGIQRIREFLIPWPASGEEREIITNKLEGALRGIEALEREVSKLKLLKQGLMHDLLTGRVRVKIEELAAT